MQRFLVSLLLQMLLNPRRPFTLDTATAETCLERQFVRHVHHSVCSFDSLSLGFRQAD